MVVVVLKPGTSKHPNLIVLLCYLLLLVVSFFLLYLFVCLPGQSHPSGWHPFCFQFQQFRQLVPHADQEVTDVLQYPLASHPVVWHRDASTSSASVRPLWLLRFILSTQLRFHCLLQAEWFYWSWWPPLPADEQTLICFAWCWLIIWTILRSKFTYQWCAHFILTMVCYMYWRTVFSYNVCFEA